MTNVVPKKLRSGRLVPDPDLLRTRRALAIRRLSRCASSTYDQSIMNILRADSECDKGKIILSDQSMRAAVEKARKYIELRNEEEERLRDAFAKVDQRGIDVTLYRVGKKCEDVFKIMATLIREIRPFGMNKFEYKSNCVRCMENMNTNLFSRLWV